MTPRCSATMEDRHGPWYCSLASGHDGPHQACEHHDLLREPLRMWPGEREQKKDNDPMAASLMGNLIYLLNDIKELMVENNELLKDLLERGD